jgi:hypothetical protein
LSIEANNTFHCRNQDLANLITPDTGPPGAVVGSMGFKLVKFDNGGLVNNNSTYVSYSRSALVPNSERYMFDIWMGMEVSSASWTTIQFICQDREFGAYDGITLGFGAGGNKGKVVLFVRNKTVDTVLLSPAQTWAVNSKIYLSLIIDKNASFDGAKTVSLRWNKVEIISSSVAIDFDVTNSDYELFGISTSNQSAIHIALDNWKFYNQNQVPLYQEVLDNSETEFWPVTFLPGNAINNGLNAGMNEGIN